MTARTFIYKKLTSSPVVDHVGGADDPRVFAKKTMASAVEEHPFIVYKLGVDSNEDLSENIEISRQYLQIWVHDVNLDTHADYMRIDQIIADIKKALFRANSALDGIWITTFIETSQDFNDDTLNTLFKYARFHMIRRDV